MYQEVKHLDELVGIRRLSDQALIPLDESNGDYQKYLEWLAAGNEVLPAEGVVGE